MLNVLEVTPHPIYNPTVLSPVYYLVTYLIKMRAQNERLIIARLEKRKNRDYALKWNIYYIIIYIIYYI